MNFPEKTQQLFVLIEEDILNQHKIRVLGIFDYTQGTKEIQLKQQLFGNGSKKYTLSGPYEPQISNSFDESMRYPLPLQPFPGHIRNDSPPLPSFFPHTRPHRPSHVRYDSPQPQIPKINSPEFNIMGNNKSSNKNVHSSNLLR